MKTFSTNGTGSQQTLSEIESDKMPIYNTMADAEADLANLEEGQLGATNDIGDELSQPVDVVEEDNLHAVTSNAVAGAIQDSKVKTLNVTGTTNSDGFLTLSNITMSDNVVLGGFVTNINDTTVSFSHYINTIYVIPKDYADNKLPNTYVELKIAYI